MLLSGAGSRSRVKVGPAQQHWLSVNIFFSLQNHPTFHSEEQLVNLARGRECFVANCWSIYIISYYLFLQCTEQYLAGLPEAGEWVAALPGLHPAGYDQLGRTTRDLLASRHDFLKPDDVISKQCSVRVCTPRKLLASRHDLLKHDDVIRKQCSWESKNNRIKAHNSNKR